ncbi:MAG: phosphate ABC transporter permease PstA [Chloroflexi bacterium]|nr:phosphate ABC transporter permease PstA [Chloroflexota bacterium]
MQSSLLSVTQNDQRLNYRRRQAVNQVMLGLCGVAALIAILPLAWILLYVVQRGYGSLNLDFFTQLPTPVGVAGGGVFNAIVGSAMVVGLACLMAIPVSLIAAFYVYERPNTLLGTLIRFSTDVLSGVPSIIMGIFAYTVIVLTQGHFSALSGGFALAIIMTPIALRTTEEMLKLVPKTLREGSLALGAADWRTLLQVMLPAAISGVITGIMLGVARVAGEAAPMLFTAFGNPFFSAALDQPIATLPHQVYVYAISPYKDWQDKAWATALVLIALVLSLEVVARGVTSWQQRKLRGR